MSEDKLLSDLGDLARQDHEAENARFDERWDRLAAGTLSAEEDAELRALAAASPEAREAYEAFRPLSAEFQARVVSAAAAELTPPSARTAPQSEPRETRSRLLPFRRATARAGVWLGSAAALAAGLFFLLRPGMLPLPGYDPPELTGGTQVLRGGEPIPSNVFLPGSLLTLEVRPRQQVAGWIEARAFFGPAAAGGGKILPLPPGPEVAQSGVVRLQGRIGEEIRLPTGTWRIWIVVARPGKVPSAGDLTAALRRGKNRDDGWMAISADVRIDEHGPP